MRSVKGKILDKVRNEDIHKELNIFCIKVKIQEYHQDWLDHIQRMPCRRLPKAALYYTPCRKRDQGRPESVDLAKKPEHDYGLILGENNAGKS